MTSCIPKEIKTVKRKVSPRIKKEINLITPKSGSTFPLDTIVLFTLKHKKDQLIDSIRLNGDGKPKIFKGNRFEWKPEQLRTGNTQVSLTAYFKGKKEKIYPKIRFVSNINPTRYTYELVNTYPHNEKSYTQGLFFDHDYLYESTGHRGSSTIGKYDLATGEVMQVANIENKYFGEGATSWKGTIFQITWESQIAFAYDKDLNRTRTFNYSGEGWGLATWGDTLVMSDGSENIYLLNPKDFSQIDRLQIYHQTDKINFLNELEVIGNDLYANVYTTASDEIIIIDLLTGRVKGIIDLTGLIDRSKYQGIDYVLNGIASYQNRLFVTAKWHPYLYEITLLKAQ
ncbi:glutaminyl-peptide cyclotransferase [bacterium]|jgi:glutamine cyclotransferase|nr:glutaminyl-peptide cyclotransferase [bacterium]|tara:strand:+ start:588 stop:1613 length:1026 start_codon:yes stop_codon:yes gene_type:complete